MTELFIRRFSCREFGVKKLRTTRGDGIKVASITIYLWREAIVFGVLYQ